MITADLTVSLVVNTTDRVHSLRTLLRALEQQSYPHFEVVVVVGPTHDDTLEMLAAYEERVRVLRCPKANLGQSRNIGLLASRGDIVAFIDDDAVPAVHWLAQLVRLFGNPHLDATGGVVYLIHPDHAIIQHRLGIISSLAEQVDVRDSWLSNLAPPPGEGIQWVVRMMGTNMAYRRQTLLEIGGFDEFFQWVYDDSDLGLRLARAGKTICPVNEAVVYHVPASSRNRRAFSFTGRWWILTKASTYFVIKHGLEAGDSAWKILLRCLHLVHGRYLWYRQLRRESNLTLWEGLRLQSQNVLAFLIGAWHGVFTPRQLVDLSTTGSNAGDDAEIMEFQDESAKVQPSVDPVSGRQPRVTMVEPPLRICLLSSAYPPAQYEGVGRHTNLMARGLFECGHTVHVIARGDREEVSFYDGAYVHRIPGYVDRYPHERRYPLVYNALNYSHAVYDTMRRLLLNDGIQVVDSPLWQIEGLVSAISGDAPVVLRLQTAHRQIAAIERKRDSDMRLIGELEAQLIEHAAYWVPNSQATVRAISKVYGIVPDADRYTVIPHGVVPVPEEDVRPFDPTRVPETILYVGRLEKRKGIQDLFGAIPHVLDKYPAVRFVIAGKDNSRHDGFMQRTGMDYPTYFARHYDRYASRVQFLGMVSEDLLYRLYQSCDLFVAPSLYESFGLIYLEAMNYAKPVIGCAAGGIPEVVEQGTTGLLVEPEAPAALAEAISSLLAAPARLYEMGVAGRQRLLERFTYIQMAQRFAEVYRQVAQRFAAARDMRP